MTAPRRARRDDGGGGSGALAGAATLRGGLLIGAAVLIGVVLLGKGFDGGFLPSSSGDPSDQVATGGDDNGSSDNSGDEGDDESTTSTTLPAVSHDEATVKVQVLNGGGPTGSAGAATEELRAAGYTLAPDGDDAGTDVAASTVYATAGYEADAALIAAALGITGEPQTMTTPPPPATADTVVVVVLGPDFTPPG